MSPAPRWCVGAGAEGIALSSLTFLLPNGEVKQTWTHGADQHSALLLALGSHRRAKQALGRWIKPHGPHPKVMEKAGPALWCEYNLTAARAG